MGATIWLLGMMLAPAQPSGSNGLPPDVPVTSKPGSGFSRVSSRGGDWVLTPRLTRGQELAYRGTFTEEATGSRVQFQRSYRFEARYFVLDTPPRGVELAAFTALNYRQPPGSKPGASVEPVAGSVRLEKLLLDLQGKVVAPADLSLSIPMNGAPTLEVGAFVEVPRGKVVVNQSWEITEPGRPVQVWRLVGTEAVSGNGCVKLTCVQQSDDWAKPRADRSAWRRQDTLWIAAKTGITTRVERTVEQREPARTEVSQRCVLRYELETSLQYPAQLAHDRRQEINQIFQIRDASRALLGDPARYARQAPSLLRRIGYHCENLPPTPYRESLHLLKRQIEAAGRGEVQPVVHEEAPRSVKVASVGEAAPDFSATSITEPGSARLQRWKGKPVLLVFYNPESYTSTELLRFTQSVHATWGKYVSVVGLSVNDDRKVVLDQRDALKLPFPILHGGGMRLSYGVETTPKLVVLDAAGIIRGMYLGWGAETSTEVLAELRRWLGVR